MYKVMILEDDFRIAEINKTFVEQVEGFNVTGVALNGKSFLTMAKKEPPDLVILDVYLPDITGEELLLILKKSYPSTDVIMITAAKETKTLEFFLQHGIFDYLVKPVHASRLHKSLQKYIIYKEKLTREIELEQKDIDAIMDRSNAIHNLEDNYPKGIDPLTLKRVKSFFYKEKSDITVEEAGEKLGISRSTVRRYLDYLVKKEVLQAELRYGTVGRPERIYRIANKI